MVSPVVLGVLGFLFIFSVSDVYAQVIPVNETAPCFLNYTAGYKILDDCGFDEDWMSASLIGFEWVTGGYFSFMFLGVIIMFTYIKYHKMIYPLLIGVMYLPVTFTLVPTQFWLHLLLLVSAAIGFTIFKIFKNQTTEF